MSAAATRRHAAQSLQGFNHRCERPLRQRGFDMGLQPVAPCRRRLDSRDTIFQHDMMHRLVELQACQPAPVQQRPGRAVVVPAVAQQEAGQLLAGLAQGAHRRLTRTDEIADRLMGLIRNPDRGQFTGAMQLGKVDRIPPVGLDPLAWLARDQRWSDHGTFVPRGGELSLDAIAAWSGLVTKPQRLFRQGQLRGHRLQGAGVLGIFPCSRTSPRKPASANATAIVSLCTSRPT